MSKMIEATCVAGIVVADGVPVAADKLSEGVGSSEGILILDEDRAKYVAKTSPDLKSTLEKLSSCIDTIITALQHIDSVTTLITTCGAGAGTAAWLPVNPSEIAELTATKAEIDLLKESLR